MCSLSPWPVRQRGFDALKAAKAEGGGRESDCNKLSKSRLDRTRDSRAGMAHSVSPLVASAGPLRHLISSTTQMRRIRSYRSGSAVKVRVRAGQKS